MFGKLKASLLALALIQGSASAACVNDPTFEWPSIADGNKKKTCKQIRIKESRRTTMCLISEVATACPQSCGVCCEDDSTFEFPLRNNPDKIQNCTWILRNKNEDKTEKRIDRYCTKGENGTKPLYTHNNRTIRDACPKSCNFCFTTVTPEPTSGPTTGPTPAPTGSAPTPAPTPGVTQNPTLTISPSESPSRPPSPMPSPFPSDVPSKEPSESPSGQPSMIPSDQPSKEPSESPSDQPSMIPSDAPSLLPSFDPSDAPSKEPSESPSLMPSSDPSDEPSSNPTKSIKPSASPSSKPTLPPPPTPAPTKAPTPAPTPLPTISPAPTATPAPTVCSTDLPKSVYNWTLVNTTEQKVVGCDWFTKHKDDAVDLDRKNNYCPSKKSGCCASCVGY